LLVIVESLAVACLGVAAPLEPVLPLLFLFSPDLPLLRALPCFGIGLSHVSERCLIIPEGR